MEKTLTKEKLNELYRQYLENAGYQNGKDSYSHHMFFTEYILGLSPYDDEIAEKWGLVIHDVMNAIKNRKTFEFILENEQQYSEYLIVAQLLDNYQWIEWGTSIRGAWFQESKNSKEILFDVPFTVENINVVLEWLD